MSEDAKPGVLEAYLAEARASVRDAAKPGIRAALLCIEAILPLLTADESPAVKSELDWILAWLRRRMAQGDARFIRALEHETGHQVKPPRGQMRAIERLVKKGSGK